MCTIISERFNNEMEKVGMTGELIDLQFGRGFTRNILCGQSISIDQAKKLARQLHTSSVYLIGEDLKSGSTANLAPYVEISGERLKARRESMGWSQTCLCEMCGIKYPTVVSKIEVGQAHNIARDTMMAFCYFLKCDIRYLQGKSKDFGEAPTDLPDGRKEKQIVCLVQGAAISKPMEAKNLSLGKLSKRIGIPRQMLARIKSGVSVRIPETAAIRLAKLLGMTRDEIIISTKNSKYALDEEIMKSLETPGPIVVEKDPEPVMEAPACVEAEVVETSGDDMRVSLTRLAQITAFTEKHPDVLSLLDQMMDLKEEQISMITGALDLMIKGAIVS